MLLFILYSVYTSCYFLWFLPFYLFSNFPLPCPLLISFCDPDPVYTFLCFLPPSHSLADGKWGPWNHWSLCSKTCDSGWQRRYRMCQGTGLQGYPCEGSGDEVRTCNEKKCPGTHSLHLLYVLSRHAHSVEIRDCFIRGPLCVSHRWYHTLGYVHM